MRPLVLALLGLLLVPLAGAAPAEWDSRAAMPLARTEVVAATVGREIFVVGGLTLDGAASRRADAYDPARNSWRRLPDLPVAIHHAMAVGARGKLYVLGGFDTNWVALRSAYVLEGRRWRSLPRLPSARAAGGAGYANWRIVVAGGVYAPGKLAKKALSLDVRTRRWRAAPGPTPREHLAVAALGGAVYAIAGRTVGYDTNRIDFERYRPGDRSWTRLPPIPDSRGGTGAAGVRGQIVSAGGEETKGAIEEVLAYSVAERRWRQLDDLPTPRHGLGVAALGGRVFVIGGGTSPGLTVSTANESLAIER